MHRHSERDGTHTPWGQSPPTSAQLPSGRPARDATWSERRWQIALPQRDKVTVVTGGLRRFSQAHKDHHLTDLLCTNQHILSPRQWKEEAPLIQCNPNLPPHRHASSPSPGPSHFAESLLPPHVHLSHSLPSISCPLALAPNNAHLFSCCVDLCASVGTQPEPACCSSARSPIVFFPPPSSGHMVLPKGEIWALNQNTSSLSLSLSVVCSRITCHLRSSIYINEEIFWGYILETGFSLRECMQPSKNRTWNTAFNYILSCCLVQNDPIESFSSTLHEKWVKNDTIVMIVSLHTQTADALSVCRWHNTAL